MKKHLKLIIGIAALLLVMAGFFFLRGGGDLENGNLKHWAAADADRRAATVQIITGTDANTELMVACLDRMSTLPDAVEMTVRDAASLCFAGIQLKNNI